MEGRDRGRREWPQDQAGSAPEAGELNGWPLTRKGLAEEFPLPESPESTLGASYTRSSYSYHHLSQFNLDITPVGRDRYHFTDAARRGGVT